MPQARAVRFAASPARSMPAEPLPARAPRFDPVKLLGESTSAADLLARIKASNTAMHVFIDEFVTSMAEHYRNGPAE